MTVTRLPLTGPGVRLPTISSELIARHVQIAESPRSAAIRDAAERISVYPCRLNRPHQTPDRFRAELGKPQTSNLSVALLRSYSSAMRGWRPATVQATDTYSRVGS